MSKGYKLGDFVKDKDTGLTIGRFLKEHDGKDIVVPLSIAMNAKCSTEVGIKDVTKDEGMRSLITHILEDGQVSSYLLAYDPDALKRSHRLEAGDKVFVSDRTPTDFISEHGREHAADNAARLVGKKATFKGSYEHYMSFHTEDKNHPCEVYVVEFEGRKFDVYSAYVIPLI